LILKYLYKELTFWKLSKIATQQVTTVDWQLVGEFLCGFKVSGFEKVNWQTHGQPLSSAVLVETNQTMKGERA